jgi:hypothetical protein
MKQLTRWYERPIACIVGLHAKAQLPGSHTYWYCTRCRLIGEYLGR